MQCQHEQPATPGSPTAAGCTCPLCESSLWFCVPIYKSVSLYAYVRPMYTLLWVKIAADSHSRATCEGLVCGLDVSASIFVSLVMSVIGPRAVMWCFRVQCFPAYFFVLFGCSWLCRPRTTGDRLEPMGPAVEPVAQVWPWGPGSASLRGRGRGFSFHGIKSRKKRTPFIFSLISKLYINVCVYPVEVNKENVVLA